MKKILAVLLSVVMLVTLFAGCNSTPTGGNSNGNVLTIGIPMNTSVIDYETNEFTLWLEEELGVDLQFQIYATGANDYMSQLSGNILKGAKLPDVLIDFDGMKGQTWDLYGQDGYLIDLKPYMDDKEGASKSWWDHVSALDEGFVRDVLLKCEDDYGAMYVFPTVETTIIDTMDYMVNVNKTWLADCGLEQPTNIDEFYNMLVKFKEEKCTQQGYWPLVGGSDSYLSGDVVNWIINMFIYFSDHSFFNLSEDGLTLTTPFTTDLYREALAFCKKLIDEGLLYTGASREEIINLVNPVDGNPRVGMFVGHPTLMYMVDDNCIDNFEALETYWGYAVRNENTCSLGAAITADCANPDLAFKLLMLISSQEGSYRLRYGTRGTDWDWADEGAVSFMGLDATLKVLPGSESVSLSTQNKTWKYGPFVLINSENETVQYVAEGGWIAKRCDIIKGIYNSFSAAEAANNPKYICPTMTLSEYEAQFNYNERTNTADLVRKMRAAFIMGTTTDVVGGVQADINNNAHWQAYLTALQNEGLDVWLGQMQTYYVENYMEVVLGE